MVKERLDVLQGTLDLLILRTLQWGPQHGHGIGQAIRSKSDDLLQVEHGSLYPALHRLERKGLLNEEWGQTDTGRDIIGLFQTLNQAGLTIVVVTHEDRVSQACGRVIKLEDGRLVS